MGYCTVNDIKNLVSQNDIELIKLTSDDIELQDIIIQSHIDAAASIIDLYSDVKDTSDSFIILANAKIAMYYLFQRSNQEIPSAIEKGFLEMIQLLKDLRDKQVRDKGSESTFTANTKPYGKETSAGSCILDRMRYYTGV